MNEVLFFAQTFLIVSFALVALKLGQSALITWITIQAILANLFVLKQITLLNFEVTATDAFAIGSLLGLNFLQEHYGKEEAQKATWICFFTMLFFALSSQLHLLFHPSIHDTAHQAFTTILAPAPRLLLASIAVFFLVQQIDVRIFAFLKNHSNRSFVFRTAISLTISQFLDTLLFSFIGLYGLVASMIDIILISFLIKLIVIFLITPLVKWGKAVKA